ncbi:MAG: c-type cytochrome [Caulobacteraceae bacterium]
MPTRSTLLVLLSLGLIAAGCSRSGENTNEVAAPAPTAAPPPLTAAQTKALVDELPAAFRNADLPNGEAKFAICRACHTPIEGAGNMTGPNLWGIFGRKAGTEPGFSYSDSLKKSGIVWNAELIDKWITNPKAMIPDTKMTYIGMSDATDRRDLVAYLKTVTSPPPPAAPEAPPSAADTSS